MSVIAATGLDRPNGEMHASAVMEVLQDCAASAEARRLR